ncbi:hypothetical protein H0H92_008039, partial [Tricholoma furcatifolium]
DPALGLDEEFDNARNRTNEGWAVSSENDKTWGSSWTSKGFYVCTQHNPEPINSSSVVASHPSTPDPPDTIDPHTLATINGPVTPPHPFPIRESRSPSVPYLEDIEGGPSQLENLLTVDKDELDGPSLKDNGPSVMSVFKSDIPGLILQTPPHSNGIKRFITSRDLTPPSTYKRLKPIHTPSKIRTLASMTMLN